MYLFTKGHFETQKDGISTLSTELADFIMASLRSRCRHYIFALWFLLSSSFFSWPNLSHRRLDVYHTCTHGVALLRI